MSTHAATTGLYRYRIAGLDGTVHDLTLTSTGITGESMFPHEQFQAWRYELRTGGVTVFGGNDLTTPPGTSADEAAGSALYFLTVQPDDTDTAHFGGYTESQLEWCRSHAGSLEAAVEALREAPAGLGGWVRAGYDGWRPRRRIGGGCGPAI